MEYLLSPVDVVFLALELEHQESREGKSKPEAPPSPFANDPSSHCGVKDELSAMLMGHHRTPDSTAYYSPAPRHGSTEVGEV